VRLECGVAVCRGCVLLWSQAEEELARTGSGARAGERCHVNRACAGHTRPPTQAEVASLPADEAAAESVARWYAAHDSENPAPVSAPAKCGLCDDADAEFRCGECTLPFGVCGDCWSLMPIHNKRPAAHTKLPLEAAVTEAVVPPCEIHGKPLEGYCFTHRRLVCASCLFAACKAHNSVPVAAAAKSLTSYVQQRGSALSAMGAKARDAAAAIARVQEQATEKETSALGSLAAAEAQLQRAINERFASLRSEVQTEFRERQAVLADQRASLASFGAALALRARGLECALTNPTVLLGDHPMFAASIPAALAAGSVMETLTSRMEEAGRHQAAATYVAYSDVGLEAAVAAVRRASAISLAPEVPVAHLSAPQRAAGSVRLAWGKASAEQRLSCWVLTLTAPADHDTDKPVKAEVEWALHGEVDAPAAAGAGAAAPVAVDGLAAGGVPPSPAWRKAPRLGVAMLPPEASSVWLRWPSARGGPVPTATVAVRGLYQEAAPAADRLVCAALTPYAVTSPAAALTLHRSLSMRMTRGFEGTDKMPRALLELPEGRLVVASCTNITVFSTVTGEERGTVAAEEVVALALVTNQRGNAVPLCLAENPDMRSSSLRALTLGDHAVSLGANLCELSGVGHRLTTVGKAGSALVSCISRHYASLLTLSASGTFSQAQLQSFGVMECAVAWPATDHFVAMQSSQLFLRELPGAAGAVPASRGGKTAIHTPMCAVSSRRVAATVATGAYTRRTVQIIDTETGSVKRTVCTIDVRYQGVQPSREQQLRMGMHDVYYGYRYYPASTTFAATALLHASPDGRTLYTVEHPDEGGSVLKAWDTSVEDAIEPLALRRTAAVVTAMLVLKDGRIAYATVDGDVHVVAAL